jgi:hypothetical protein
MAYKISPYILFSAVLGWRITWFLAAVHDIVQGSKIMGRWKADFLVGAFTAQQPYTGTTKTAWLFCKYYDEVARKSVK